MRIVTYNIHNWQTADNRPNLALVADVLHAAQADVVGLNEVYYPRHVEGADGLALATLADRLGMHFVFGPTQGWPVQEAMPAAKGNALFSRWPIIASAAHHLIPKEAEGEQVLTGTEPRGLLEARILLPGNATFTVYVTQLDATDEEARLVQLRAARTWLGRDRHRPHIVMGDFNAISLCDYEGQPEAYAALDGFDKGQNLKAGAKGPRVIAQMEKAGYTDVYSLFGSRGQRTHLPAEQPIRIDYLFASQPLVPMVKGCEIWQEMEGQTASDHRPVVAEIEIGYY